VTLGKSTPLQGTPGGGAVEIVLDASGSMLQRMAPSDASTSPSRRVKNLTAQIIPAGIPVALRLLGRRPGQHLEG
jgi:hypothetical protein